MILKLSNYRVHFPKIKFLLENQDGDRDLNLSFYAAVAPCPIIAVYWFAGEILGEQAFYAPKIARLKEFFHYDDVVE